MSGCHSSVVGVKSITKHPCHRVAEKQECDIADLEEGNDRFRVCSIWNKKTLAQNDTWSTGKAIWSATA